MPTLHLMIGLPCSGKTTYAQALAQRTQSLLLTPEELYRRLEHRNKSHFSTTFVIPKEEMEKYLKVFQPPTPEELRL